LSDASVDGVISVEAAFHFPSRARFLAEAFRVLRPGGVLSFSDVSTERRPAGPLEAVAGLTQLRLWGLRTGAARSAAEIEELVRRAGFVDVEVTLAGSRVIEPALRFVRARLDRGEGGTTGMRVAARALLTQVELLWRRGLLEYPLISARTPA
jgi:SAM-dependent methyltransferase